MDRLDHGPARQGDSSSGGMAETLIFDKLTWTIDDVARELQVSVRHVYKLISDDRIPYAKVGRAVRFSPWRIREWLTKGGTR